MLLQTQYKWWWNANKLLVLLFILLVVLSLFFKWRIYSIENSIKESNAEIVKLQNNIKDEKNKWLYNKLQIASVISDKENNVNYYALYNYLNNMKNEIINLLWKNTFNYNRFILKISKNKVHMSLMVPSFNSLYWWAYKNSKWEIVKYNLFEWLDKKPFIESISVESYKVKWNFVYFDMDLKTK